MSQGDDHRDTFGEHPEGAEGQRSPESGDSAPKGGGWTVPGQDTAPPVTAPGSGPQGPDQPGYAYPSGPSQGPPPGYGVPHGYGVPGGPSQGPPPGYGPPPGLPPGHGASPGAHGQRPPYGHGRPNAPKPGVVALRPMSLGDVFNGAFSYVRNNPKTTVGLSMVVMAIASILSVVASTLFLDDYTTFMDEIMADPTAVDPDAPLFPSSPLTMALMYLGELIVYVGGAVLLGLLAAVVGMAVLGHKLTPGQAWAAARDRFGAIIGLAMAKLGILVVVLIVAFLAVLIGVFVGVMIGVGAGSDIAAGLFGLLFALLAALVVAAPAMWIWIRLYYAMPIVVLERMGPFRAMARSWRLSKGSWWRTLGYWLLAALIVALVQMVLSAPAGLLGMVLGFTAADAAWTAILIGALTYVLTVLLFAVTQPFVAGVNTLLYIDLRMRREGLDLRLHQATQRGESVRPEIYLPEPRA